jgi:hypothetical protein
VGANENSIDVPQLATYTRYTIKCRLISLIYLLARLETPETTLYHSFICARKCTERRDHCTLHTVQIDQVTALIQLDRLFVCPVFHLGISCLLILKLEDLGVSAISSQLPRYVQRIP